MLKVESPSAVTQYPATAATARIDYDAAGNTVTAGTVGGENAYVRNDRFQLAEIGATGGNSTYGYNSDGLLTTRTDVFDVRPHRRSPPQDRD